MGIETCILVLQNALAMPQMPFYIPLTFILTTLLTLYFFYRASGNRTILFILFGWLVLQGIIAYTGFYTVTGTLPPRFLWLVLPPMLVIMLVFVTRRGRAFLDKLNDEWLAWLHVVRVPVELVLYWLYLEELIPVLMVFEGHNFDILSGFSAPVIAWLGYVQHRLPKGALLAWNIVCLGLLLNIVIRAVLSAETPFQQFAFDQPNRGLLFFPFIWLPCCIVQLVFFSHLAVIRRLLVKGPVADRRPAVLPEHGV